MKYIRILVLAMSSLWLRGQTLDNRLELRVSQDGTGDYTSIQQAINQVRDHAEKKVVIHIAPGKYIEKVVIPTFKRNIILRGEDKDRTVISFDDYSGKAFRGIDVTGDPKFSTYTSYTLLLGGNDCALENLTIENTAGRIGQAVALHTEGDRILVRNCSILGNQDSLYVARGGSRVYFDNCFINGTVDFIFGAATAYFYKCTIESLRNGYITAASTTAEEAYGFVFEQCRLTAKDPSVDKVYLGRPWRPYAKTVLISCVLGEHIVPQGWDPWKGDKNFPDKEKTVLYAEYTSEGLGAKDLSQRALWSRQLKKSDLWKYLPVLVFRGWEPR